MKKVIFGVFSCTFMSSPVLADNWALSCKYESGTTALIKYDAGRPSHSISITAKGSSILQRTPFLPAARLTAPNFYSFIVDRERIGRPNEHSFVIRLDTKTMKSTLQGGNGASWDYVSLSGECLEI